MSGDPLPDYGPIVRRRATDRRSRRRVQPHHARRRPATMLRVVAGLFGTLVLLLFLIAVAGLIALDRAYSGRIISNVTIRGLDLSQMRPNQARAALHQRYAAFLAAPVMFQFEGYTWRPTAAQIGMSLEIDVAVERAYAAGRGPNLVNSLSEALAIWQNGIDLPLRLIVDQRRLQAYVTSLAREVEVPPQNAHVTVLKARIVSTAHHIGRQALVDQTVGDVLAGLAVLQPQTVVLRTRMLRPLVDDAGVAEVRRQLSGLLQSPIALTAGEQRWIWTPEELGDIVELARVPNDGAPGSRIVTTLNRDLLARRLNQLAQEIDAAPVEARLQFSTAGLRITKPGRDGARLEVGQALDQLMAALWEDQRTIALPVTVLQPQARPETLAHLGVVELVAQGKSSFENSAPYRVTNIQAGARQMNGVLIAPGEEFSFNRTIGAVDESNGFTQGYAIIDGRTQLEWGGGVCQVSTTVFRAAFWAGVPITERNQHSFRIRWYEKFEPIGMDAAIFTGPDGYDLRFVNDTAHWLLMETVVDTAGEVLTVNLYGTRSSHKVIQTPPAITNEVPAPTKPRYVDDPGVSAGIIKQTDTARGGMDVRVGRIVKQNGKVLLQDTFFSRFQPWPDVFVRGTGP